MCHRVTVKDTKGDDKAVSQEDLMFLSTLKDGIKKNAQGHYDIMKRCLFHSENRLPYLITKSLLKSGSVIFEGSSVGMKNTKETTQHT